MGCPKLHGTVLVLLTFATPSLLAGWCDQSWGGYFAGSDCNYQESHLQAFLDSHAGNPNVKRTVLCKSPDGHDVPILFVGRLDGSAKLRAWVQCRQHPKEWKPNCVMEGWVDTHLSDPWLRDNVELAVVPWVAYDGMIDHSDYNVHGTQYNREWLKPDGRAIAEVEAIRQFVKKRWNDGRLKFHIDFHCPNLDGGGGSGTSHLWWCSRVLEDGNREFRDLANRHRTSRSSTSGNFGDGVDGGWAPNFFERQPGVEAAGTLEFRENTMSIEDCRGYGRDLAVGLREFLKKRAGSVPAPGPDPVAAVAIVKPESGSTLTAGIPCMLEGTGENLRWFYDADSDGLGRIEIGTGTSVSFTVPAGIRDPKTLILFLEGTGGSASREYRLVEQTTIAAPRASLRCGSTQGQSLYGIDGRRVRWSVTTGGSRPTAGVLVTKATGSVGRVVVEQRQGMRPRAAARARKE